jgi:hypothetical protein
MTGSTNAGNAVLDTAVNSGVDLVAGLLPGAITRFVPGVSTGIEEAKANLRRQAREAAEKSPEANGFMQRLNNIFSGLREWLRGLMDMFTNWKSPGAVEARHGLLAQVGIDAKGNEAATNPFAAIDQSLGINVSSAIRKECESKIRDFVGLFGMGSAENALQHSMAAHDNIRSIIYEALIQRHAIKPEDEAKLAAVAEQAASSITGLDPKALASSNPMHYLTQTPPAKGFAALLHGTGKSQAVAALTLDNTALTGARSDLASVKGETQQILDQSTRAAADQAAAGVKDKVATAPQADGAPASTLPPAARVLLGQKAQGVS